MQRIKGVIFDLDGTIGDTLPLCIKAFRQSVEPLIGRTVSDAAIIETFGPSEEGTIMALAPNHYDRGVADYLLHYASFHEMCPSAFAGVTELLRTLKEAGVRIAMVTGKGKHSTAITLRQFELEGYFEFIETGVQHGPSKPEGIRLVLEQFGDLAKEEVIYVGDAPSDITASRLVGIPVVAAAWAETADPEKLKALQPDAICYSIDEFATWLYARM